MTAPITVELESRGDSARVIIHGDHVSVARRSAQSGHWNTHWRGTLREVHLMGMAIDAATAMAAERDGGVEAPQRLAITVQAPVVA